MSNRDALAKLIGEALGADESAGCGGGYVDDSSLGSTVLDGRFDLEALAEAVIAAGWLAPSAEKTATGYTESAEAMRERHGVTEDAALVMDSDGARFEQKVGWDTIVTPVVPPTPK